MMHIYSVGRIEVMGCRTAIYRYRRNLCLCLRRSVTRSVSEYTSGDSIGE